jgi:hypothetical protein
MLGRFLLRATGTGPYSLTRFLVLRLLGFVYFFAFLSLAVQVLPLIGSRGLLPAHAFLERVDHALGSRWDAFLRVPTLFWLADSDALLQSLAWLGVGLSLLLLAGFANSILLALLWALYMSFVHVGQEWYAYGWEIQLLETGFLAIFLAPLLDPRPFPKSAPPLAVIVLLRWLVFRIMIGAGLIKMRGDPCWRDLTCLCWHYETQPLPNPLSPVLHFMPHAFHVAGVLFNHAAELVAPWFVFWPRRARHVAGAVLLLFQVTLIASGNLSFLNWLTIVPILACFDDGLLARILPRRFAEGTHAAISMPRRVASGVLLALVAWLSLGPVENLLSQHQAMNTSFGAFDLVNTYGAFGTVGKERNEIVFEGTDDETIGPVTKWKAYEFPAKPGDPNRRPPIVAPFQWRLDWSIWFAAMSEPERYPWTLHFVSKLLHGDRATIGLLANDPFPSKPPRFVRAELYRYRFAPPGDRAWWSRERVDSWLPPLSADDPNLRAFLRHYGWDEYEEKDR